MEGQIVEITRPGCFLHKVRGFLEVRENDESLGRVPLDDIAAVIISVLGCSVSTVLIDQLCGLNIPLVMCGKNYIPSSMTLPLSGYGRQFHVMQAQMTMTAPKRKRIWQKIVRAKIKNQATVLHRIGENNQYLLRLVDKVRSGDPDNCEAQAARQYWQKLFGSEFRRDRNATGINTALNYTYAIVRACVARGISSAGLHPSFSLHHKNPQNPLNLVDDLIEPFRPIADYVLLLRKDIVGNQLTPEIKSELASVVTLTVPLEQESVPLSLAAAKMCRSLAKYYLGERDDIVLPDVPSPLEMYVV